MRTNRPRTTSRHSFLLLFISALLLIIAAFGAAAQGASIQIDPTEEPGTRFQANPTEAPPREPGGFQANPTEAPTREPIDDIQVNPTEPPTREPGDFQANPTAVPTREPIDDIQIEPTAEPTEVIDDEAIPTAGTVRAIKRDCPLGVPEDLDLTEYLQICTQPHDGVEFVLNDVNSGNLGVTAGGVVEWTGVDPGVFNITETIPAGYGDPIVFCGYTESPGGGVQHPALQDSTGGVVAGTFPDAMFEFVCYWMNIKTTGQVIPGADDIANPGGGTGVADLLVMKRSCPDNIPSNLDAGTLLDLCEATVNGVEFTVSHGNGTSTKSTVGGEATWTGLPLGPFSIEEHLPANFGDPIFICGWTAIHDGIVYDAFAQPVEVEGGVHEAEITVPNTLYFCYVLNIHGAPGDIVDPGSSLSSFVVRKLECREGTPAGQDRDYYLRNCELMIEPVEFTLTTADGAETRNTSGGFAAWDLLPTGEFSLQETIPDGYLSPVAFCGWYAYWGGFHYDAFPAPVPSPGGLIEGDITIPNTDYHCDVVNIPGEIDDIVANPTAVPTEEIDDITAETTGTVRVIKRDCPLGIVEDATLAEYLTLCPSNHDGVEFTLDSSDGTRQGTTAAGQVEWIGVPAGMFTITETIPPGYTDPIVHCGFTESPGGGVQHPSLPDSANGVIAGTLPEPPFEYVCYVLNIQSTGQIPTGPGGITQDPGDPDSTFTVFKLNCPSGTPLDQETYWYLDNCDTGPNGVLFTLTTDEGSSTKPIVNGHAVWDGLPLGPWTLEEDVPPLYGEPIFHCGWTAFWDGKIYDAFAQLVPSSGGIVEGEITIPNTGAFCFALNMAGTPGSFEAPQDTTNVLVARKWVCPAGIRDNEPADPFDQMGYYLRLCEQETEPVEFTLTNADGVSTQATSGGKVEWDDVPLGAFTLQESIPAGYEEPKVFCGWTAFYMGAVYDGFHQPVPSTDGLVEYEVSIPNTHMLCHYLNIPVEIDAIQANPTVAPEIDDVIAGQGEPNADIEIEKSCPTVPAGAGVGDEIAYEVTITNTGNVTLYDVNVIETREGAYDAPFPTELAPGESATRTFTSLITPEDIANGNVNNGVAVTASGDVGASTTDLTVELNVECALEEDSGAFQANPTEVPAIDDVVANPTAVPTEEIDDITASPHPHIVGAQARACPDGIDPPDDYWQAIDACSEPIAGVAFSLTATGGAVEGVSDVSGSVEWSGVDLGASGEIQLQEAIPDGYGEPEVWCVSFPEAAGDPFDYEFFPYEAQDGLITASPEQHEPYRFACVFLNVTED